MKSLTGQLLEVHVPYNNHHEESNHMPNWAAVTFFFFFGLELGYIIRLCELWDFFF